jgi:hypothetical protein
MEDIGYSFVAAWTIHPKKRTTLSLPRKEPPCQKWSRPLAKDWHVEEHFENGKDLGMDHYEVRSFIGWYRHMTLVLLALAYLAGICATERFSTVPPPPSESVTRPPALPLTIPEVRHLLARLIWPSSSSTHRVLGCRVVASLPPKRGELLPHQTSFEGRLILADSYSLGFALARDHFLDCSEISWKCRSSWKSVRVLSPICSFLAQEF